MLSEWGPPAQIHLTVAPNQEVRQVFTRSHAFSCQNEGGGGRAPFPFILAEKRKSGPRNSANDRFEAPVRWVSGPTALANPAPPAPDAPMTEDWNPESYARFTDLRLRPALDLLGRVGALPEGTVIDLGCGAGAVAPALRTRFPDRRIIGLDASPAMLDKARATGAYDRVRQGDAGSWTPDSPPALIFSNALLHWLPDHAALFPRLADSLAPGGTLAVQMPRQQMAPSHALMREVAARDFAEHVDTAGWQPQVADPRDYARLLGPAGPTEIWETEYLQRLDPVGDGHPVRHFTQSTALRPFLEALPPADHAAFVAAYEAALAQAYPAEPDGSVLFPFRRLFLIHQRP